MEAVMRGMKGHEHQGTADGIRHKIPTIGKSERNG